MTYDNGHGSATIGVTVGPDWTSDPKHPAGTDDFYACASRGPMTSCQSTVLPDGSRLLVWEGRVFAQIQRGADLLRADGVRITASTTSLMDARRETVLTEQPPVSLEKLEAIVRAPTWTARIDEGEASRAATTIAPYRDQRVASAAPTP
ncbi:hypothetical protein [Kitasatospora sp. NPDC088346]|uniref:hypothetical protein n=1 Tax=Kitasatospora sp. NPDC088346 TaxID=3364073 RepID=UPI0037F24BC3